ncbi:MAG: flagellar biosynthetic protein FliQ [Alphaproteobacteria bacterium]|jgi:flagellar biosynthetic protein FliQ|nr:flagellar biosynthetic protein FliQ [Alphaproteobacteria bacterium]MCB1552060.1 flagellar biosynthetic protein FliQ [Alphaproteobacteria bacterium]MCB9984409.1 flagellar biosynthetic protein FliQ [Micavibrio sp.]HPQ50937.1 flagellar biosynthetic protein FliQ [Alphaproteobacteria bacterium]HRK97825.1 flagellar biosynthetic protein FliQ [Alphaproteobacteria bacterium]
MDENEVVDLVRAAIMLSIELSAPVMLVGLVVGTAIALVQALTQVQEVTLVFVPKILAIFLAIFIGLPMMTVSLVEFMNLLADRIVAIK